MSLQKLENYSNKAVIAKKRVALILTELLEDITSKHASSPETEKSSYS